MVAISEADSVITWAPLDKAESSVSGPEEDGRLRGEGALGVAGIGSPKFSRKKDGMGEPQSRGQQRSGKEMGSDRKGLVAASEQVVGILRDLLGAWPRRLRISEKVPTAEPRGRLGWSVGRCTGRRQKKYCQG